MSDRLLWFGVQQIPGLEPLQSIYQETRNPGWVEVKWGGDSNMGSAAGPGFYTSSLVT